MTVCIAGLADNKRAVIMASDNMITKQMPPVEYEHKELPKIIKIDPSFYVLVAGAVNNAMAVIDLAKDQINRDEGHLSKFDKMCSCFKQYRLQKIESVILSANGFASLKEFCLLQPQLNNNITISMQNMIERFNLNIEMILVAVADKKCYIRFLGHPGDLFDPLEYATIGSGGLQATQSLISAKYSYKEDINTSAYLIFEAKKKAEVTPGVGEMTDMIVLYHKDDDKLSVKTISDEEIKKLKKVYDKVNLRNPVTIKRKLANQEFSIT
jgi:20S proteasome alpha/beta subunit